MPKKKKSDYTIWNTNREGGWSQYKELTGSEDKFKCIFDSKSESNSSETTTVMSKIDKTLEKIKYEAFGKVKRKSVPDPYSKLSEGKSCTELLKAQREHIETELKRISDVTSSKSKVAAVFDVLNRNRGGKHQNQELVAMKDPVSSDLILDPSHLKEISLEYCVNLLQNDDVDLSFASEIYTENLVHYLRCYEESSCDESLLFSDFVSRISSVASKCPEKYKFLLNSGQSFQKCIFDLFSKVWETEKKPQQWRNTVIIQLYKKKGDISSFDAQRNIHTKDYIPKLFEGIVVDKSREKIIKSTSKFQIGGIPGHRSQEHLFCVKSVIELYSELSLPLYIQIFDISKYFDKEILKDAMDTLYRCGIRGKMYRLWYELNRDSQIRVKTAAGMTKIKAIGENVTQGSIGGAILSSSNLDKTLTAYFSGSDSELSYGAARLSPFAFQDDVLRMSNSIEAVQKGNFIIENVIKRKQLTLSIPKCSVIVFDRKNRIGQVRKAINEGRSLEICNKNVEVREKDEYLGDVIHEGGIAKSVRATVDKRYGRIKSVILEVSAILDDFRIDALGGLSAGLDIYKYALLPSLLNNADTWTGIDSATEKILEDLQNLMFRCLFAVPNSTPKPLLRFDLGNLSIIEKIHVKKLYLLHHLKHLDKESLGAEFYEIQAKLRFPGLINECRNLIKFYSLPNIIDLSINYSKQAWKNIVKKGVQNKSEILLKEKLKNYSKLSEIDLSNEGLVLKDYVKHMTLRNARTKFRIRSHILDVKMNRKSDPMYAKNLWKCDFC